ncbi:unnamed protein product [Didymodactylos carnosus]|uniref:Alpha-galactosidase n=1 Tax=Didymodactylos carnosus TaxID=1234261 RepID=A0A815NKY1_9BILA|nr:unnamed protein product [Didymodactylos carnosus]CAF1433455.1 unnamed protein product [Didymodactylos carnosus]CAF4083067.1 unnamed protein product [Didymodactylos carnosus]CAF4311530.1 unnamed protein product [Didymodactylos carnosus]
MGYTYLNIDDCWAYQRDEHGIIHEDTNTFPSGIKALADYVHSKNLKFGIYSDAGNKTCAGRPGSLGFETQDAETYASWGVDYLKYDNCNAEHIVPMLRYPIMRDALNKTGRPIFYSMCEWGEFLPSLWAKKVGNSWRTTPDISDKWATMLLIIDANNLFAEFAGPGGWNDPGKMVALLSGGVSECQYAVYSQKETIFFKLAGFAGLDMLEIGNGHMSSTEYISYMSLWAISKAPLLIGCDVTNMSADTLKILANQEVIKVNQDALGVQGSKIRLDLENDLEVWAGPLADGAQVVLLLNRSLRTQGITVFWNEIGFNKTQIATVRDLWKHEDLGDFQQYYNATAIDAHAVVMLKIKPKL